jgi:hypothetical protein
LPNWETSPYISYISHDFLNDTLPLDEAILEVMTLFERTWEDSHHQSSFISTKERLETQNFCLSDVFNQSHIPSTSNPIISKGNLSNITKKNSVEILEKTRVMEHI